MATKKSPIDKYLADAPDADRRALERIRRIVMKAYPAAKESTMGSRRSRCTARPSSRFARPNVTVRCIL
jgi:hypothetical protein